MPGEMQTLIVTRHLGAVEWLRRKGFQGEIIDNLTEIPTEPKRIVGVLPLQLAYQALAAGHELCLIQFSTRQGPRGDDLSADEMEAAGAKLFRFGLREFHLCWLGEHWVRGTVANGCNQCGDYLSVELALEEA
jgi:CRISPR-associated protein Csx16